MLRCVGSAHRFVDNIDIIIMARGRGARALRARWQQGALSFDDDDIN